MNQMNQKGLPDRQAGIIAQLVILLVVAAGLIGGLYLVQHPQIFKPKASNPAIVFKKADGSALAVNSSGVPQTDTPTVKVEITSTLGVPVFASPTTAPTSQPATSSNPDCTNSGDVNGDGSVNVSDVQKDVNSIAGNDNLTADQKTKADVNGDGKVDLQDATTTLQYVVKKIPNLPKCPKVLGTQTSSQTSGTISYKVAESPNDLSNAQDTPYTQDPTTISYTFKDTTPGQKFLWVEFKDVTGRTDRQSGEVDLVSSSSSGGGNNASSQNCSGTLALALNYSDSTNDILQPVFTGSNLSECDGKNINVISKATGLTVSSCTITDAIFTGSGCSFIKNFSTINAYGEDHNNPPYYEYLAIVVGTNISSPIALSPIGQLAKAGVTPAPVSLQTSKERCDGASLTLSLSPSSIYPSNLVTPTVTTNSPSCNGWLVYIGIGNSCAKNDNSDCIISGTGCTGRPFMAPAIADSYQYSAAPVSRSGLSEAGVCSSSNPATLTVSLSGTRTSMLPSSGIKDPDFNCLTTLSDDTSCTVTAPSGHGGFVGTIPECNQEGMFRGCVSYTGNSCDIAGSGSDCGGCPNIYNVNSYRIVDEKTVMNCK